MSVHINLPESAKAQAAFLAKMAGMSPEDFMRHAILEKIEDLKDLEIALQRLDNPVPMLSHEEARKVIFGED